MKRNVLIILLCTLFGLNFVNAQNKKKNIIDELAKPVQNGIWLQPAQGEEAMAIWGFADGIRIGLAPLPGPRGLVRIYTPYLEHPDFFIMNYIAFEPIAKSTMKKGYSEHEWSDLDNVQGKRFVSSDTDVAPKDPNLRYPAKGVIATENGRQTLTVYVFSEKFRNGAEVYVKFKFTEGFPYEFEMTPFVKDGSVELERINLTATMGNRARLRTLFLADGKTVEAPILWSDYKDVNFTKRHFIPSSEMIKDNKGGVWFIGAPNEKDPSKAIIPEHSKGWRYPGKKATQYWYCSNPGPNVEGAVNGRYTYWMNHFPIPGGIAYENFDMTEPLRSGQKYIFGISPLDPKQFIKEINNRK